MDHGNDVLITYEKIFLIFEVAYISIFVLSNIKIFEILRTLELIYGYGFIAFLAMFVVWIILLKT